MNNRFKFRVWDKYTHETPAEEMQFLCFNGCLVDSDGCHHSPEHFIIEQCTGLSDKNGNLIYEGDVVWDGEYTWQIKWNKVFARWVLYSPLGSNEDGEEELTDTDAECLKIIGNIHEQVEHKKQE